MTHLEINEKGISTLGFSVSGDAWRAEFNVRADARCDRALVEGNAGEGTAPWIEAAQVHALELAPLLTGALDRAEPGTPLTAAATRKRYPLPTPAQLGYPESAYR